MSDETRLSKIDYELTEAKKKYKDNPNIKIEFWDSQKREIDHLAIFITPSKGKNKGKTIKFEWNMKRETGFHLKPPIVSVHTVDFVHTKYFGYPPGTRNFCYTKIYGGPHENEWRPFYTLGELIEGLVEVIEQE